MSHNFLQKLQFLLLGTAHCFNVIDIWYNRRELVFGRIRESSPDELIILAIFAGALSLTRTRESYSDHDSRQKLSKQEVNTTNQSCRNKKLTLQVRTAKQNSSDKKAKT
jgi:hypothetical protein